MKSVDVLGFAGGFTLGMVQSGFELVGKREMKGGFGVANCDRNRHLLGDGWQWEASDPTQWSVVNADVVFGNPPCSGFSGMSTKNFRGANSPINRCMWSFVDYAARVRPQVAVFESVQLAFTRQDGLALMRALRQDLEDKTNDQWTLTHVLHNAYSVGGCSQRRRYFWVASRVPFGIEWPTQERLPVLHDAIGDLEALPLYWAAQPTSSSPSWWADGRTRSDALVDGHTSLRNPLVERVVDLLAKTDWRAREHLAMVTRRVYQQEGRLPDSWRDTEAKIVANDFRMGFNTPVRWAYDEPARVITGAGPMVALHPVLPRMLTYREIARVMGYPDDWLIEPLRNLPGLGMTWGKGITVDCGRWIGQWIKTSLEGAPGSFTGQLIGDREYLIDVTDAWRRSVVQSDLTHRKFRKLLNTSLSKEGSMTEPIAPEVPTEGEAVTAETETAKGGKGRPRPAHTIELDERGFAAITAAGETGHTKETLAQALGVTEGKAYLVLYRLRVENQIHKVRKDGKYVWVAGAAPEETSGEMQVAPEAPAEQIVI